MTYNAGILPIAIDLQGGSASKLSWTTAFWPFVSCIDRLEALPSSTLRMPIFRSDRAKLTGLGILPA